MYIGEIIDVIILKMYTYTSEVINVIIQLYIELC
jgi:hypothetical protein